jgi:hypothetical protein
MDLAFSVPISVTETRRFPALVFYFCGRLIGRNAFPFVRLWSSVRRSVCQAKFVRRSELSIPSAAAFGDLDKPQRLRFTNARCNCVPVDAITHKIIIRHGKFAVICAAVICKLDLNSVDHASG